MGTEHDATTASTKSFPLEKITVVALLQSVATAQKVSEVLQNERLEDSFKKSM